MEESFEKHSAREFKETFIKKMDQKYEINGARDYYLTTYKTLDDDGDDWTTLYLVNKDGKVREITTSYDIGKNHGGNSHQFCDLMVEEANYNPETKKIKVSIKVSGLMRESAISDIEIEL